VASLEVERRSKAEGFRGEHIAVEMDPPVDEKDEVFLVRREKLELFRGR
jgi:hypothetical protein